MKLQPFLLDQWLSLKFTNAVEYDLASSMGPAWTLRDLFALLDPEQQSRIFDMSLIYSDAPGAADLRQSIGRFCDVPADDVLVVTGASEALLILFFLAAESGANVVLPFPVFPPVAEVPKALGLEVRSYSLRRENRYQPDIDEIKRLVDRNTKLIFVNTPHNPTGSVLTDEELQSLHDFAVDRNIPFVVDEVYHPLYHSIPRASATRLPHAIVLGDFSKALCLSGLRIGWIVERDKHRFEKYLDARSYFTISNSPLTELLGAFALQHSDNILARARKILAENLSLLDSFFAENSSFLQWVRPEGGTTGFPWLVSENDARPFCQAMLKHGVLLTPGDCFGMPSHFRIGFGESVRDIRPALERITSLLRSSAIA